MQNYNYLLMLFLGCSKDILPTYFEETPITENNISSISDTIESVINAACVKRANISRKY